MVRKLAAALLGVGVMVPGLVQALGLGGIKLNSALSEPLDAEIELVQVRELTEDEIMPALASNADFSAAGVEKYHFLTELKFDVVVNPNGRSYIKVTSRKPMKEPFVNFLVEVHWPDGRLLREYTMLLDPPVYRAQAAPAIQRSTVSVPKAAPQTAPRVAQPASRPAPSPAYSAPAPAAAGGTGSGGTYGPTGPSDSLWGIASQMRPSSRVNVQQTMLAIQRLNPQAFVNGNINLLKRGQVLRAPSEEDVMAITAQDAARMVAEQNQAWREKRPVAQTAQTAQVAPVDTTGKGAGTVPARETEETGKLSLVSPAKTEAVAAETAQGGEASGTGGVLRDKLAMAEETTDKFKLENEDLKLKLNDLQQQTETTNQVLKLKDDQIAALQAKMAELQAQLEQIKAGNPGAAVPTPAPSSVAPVDVPASDATSTPAEAAAAATDATPAADTSVAEVDYNYESADAAPVPSDNSTAPAAPESAPTIAAESTPVSGGGVVSEITKPALVEPEAPQAAEPAAEAPTLAEEIMSNWFYLLGIAGLGAAGLIGATMARRKKAESNDLEESLVKDFSLPAQSSTALDAIPSVDLRDAEPVAQAPKKEEAVPQTNDVVGEADIYIAYGRFAQAAEMLEKAAAKEPNRDDIRLKLLEVAAEAKDPALFDRHAAVVRDHGNAASIARMDTLRSKLGVAGAAAVAAAPVAPAVQQVATKEESVDEFEPLDFDAGSLNFDSTASTKADSGAVGGLDFSLDFKMTEAPVEKKVEPVKAPVADDNSLDFDLEIDLEKEFQPAAKPAPSAAAAEEALDFDGDFQFAESDTGLPAETGVDQGLDLEFESDRTVVADLDDNAPLEFELVDDLAPASSPEALAEDDDVKHAMDFEKEDTIDSSSAALLADELDLDATATDTVTVDEFELDEVAVESPVAAAPAPVAFKAPAPAAGEEDLDFITDGDEASTKLDLARAYIDMGDREGARDILDEVLAEGNADQQREARELLSRLE